MIMNTTTNLQNNLIVSSSFAELLNLRTRFEEIVSFRKTYDLPNYNSDIDSLYYFIKHGAKNNRFRKRFDEALSIAQFIVKRFENEKTNISSIHWEEE